jgi:porin
VKPPLALSWLRRRIPCPPAWVGPAALAILAVAIPRLALAAQAAPDPDLTIAVRETAEVWRNTSGGAAVGDTTLNKLQVSATWTAKALGDPNFHAHLQLFRTNGERLSSRVGDVQTVSNIEALSTDRLFEAWVEQGFGKAGAGGVALRVGLIDLNSDFDAIAPAGLFINSSHGIAPDLSKSGRNGPSIFPVSSAAVRLTWTPTQAWTVRAGIFDGLPGDPNHPKAFAAVRISARDGALGVVEVDHKLGQDAQISAGAWAYDARFEGFDTRRHRGESGVFAFVEGPLPRLQDWTAWIRLGAGDPDLQIVSGYLGAGVVRKGPWSARPDDRLGFAVAHAFISPQARRSIGLEAGETTWEATYQVKATDWLAVQPDVQYVVHPSSQAGLPNALVVGLRIVVTAGYPKKTPATEQADPTVPPDNPDAAPPT